MARAGAHWHDDVNMNLLVPRARAHSVRSVPTTGDALLATQMGRDDGALLATACNRRMMLDGEGRGGDQGGRARWSPARETSGGGQSVGDLRARAMRYWEVSVREIARLCAGRGRRDDHCPRLSAT